MNGLSPVLISSSLYAYRNWDKAANAKNTLEFSAASGVVAGQLTNVAKATATYDKAVGDTAKEAVNSLSKYRIASTKTGMFAKNTLNWASKNVNPLLCVIEGARVLNDDDKPSAVIEGSSALITMFKSEAFMKTKLNKIVKVKGWQGAVLKGVVMFLTSFVSYNVGKEVGKTITGRD